jgi:hypothetical protein
MNKTGPELKNEIGRKSQLEAESKLRNETEEKLTRSNNGQPEDISPKLREIFRRKRRLALAKQRQGNRCSLLVLVRVMLHVYRRMHRRVVNMFVRTFVGVNLVRVLHRRPDVVKPLD